MCKEIAIYDIVYIKGNPSSGTPTLHEKMDSSILKIIEDYKYIVVDSEHKNLSGKKIPKSKVYIGFSRGSRYLKKLDSFTLKISIGGISGSKIHLFRDSEDKILLGDLSDDSMQAHFMLSSENKVKIKVLIDDFLKK